jgi:hypothetical protein
MILRLRAFLLSDICVDDSCLGQSYEIQIGGHSAKLLTPQLESRLPDAHPHIAGWDTPQPSSFESTPSDSPINPDRWGTVFHYSHPDTYLATISSVLIEMDVEEAALTSLGREAKVKVEGPVVAVAQHDTHSFLERVREWTGVVVNQHTGDPRLRRSVLLQNRVWAWNAEACADCGSNVGDGITVTLTDVECMNRQEFAYVIARASFGDSPPPARSFLASARNALRQHQFRHAVLDAATSAESVLSGLLDQEFAGLNEEFLSVLRQQHFMLRRMIELLDHRGLPKGLRADLNEVRNRVIHQGMSPSKKQAEKAVKLAGELVAMFAPLNPPIE